MRILITGGAGYIGTATAIKLIELGHEVTCVDSKRSTVEGVNEHACTRFEDLTTDTVSAFDVCYHFAALSEVRNPSHEHHQLLKAPSGAFHLISQCRYGETRLVFASSCAAAFRLSAYGTSKRMIELMICNMMTPSDATILRYHNVAGGDQPNAKRLIPSLLRLAAGREETLTVTGNLTRDYVHIDDVAEANVLALTDQGGDVGTAVASSTLDVIKCVKKITGSDLAGIRPGRTHPMDHDCSVASQAGFFVGKKTLEEIVSDAWESEKKEAGL